MASSISPQKAYADNRESLFNKAGCIPFVSTITGTVRTVGSAFIAVYQVAKAVFYQIAISIETLKHRSGNKDALAGKIASLKQQKNDALTLAQKMLLHVGRGFIEVVPFVGNTVCSVYDKENMRNENRDLKKQNAEMRLEIQKISRNRTSSILSNDLLTSKNQEIEQLQKFLDFAQKKETQLKKDLTQEKENAAEEREVLTSKIKSLEENQVCLEGKLDKHKELYILLINNYKIDEDKNKTDEDKNKIAELKVELEIQNPIERSGTPKIDRTRGVGQHKNKKKNTRK